MSLSASNPEAVTAIASGKVIVSLSDRQLFEEYVIKYTDPGFWKVFDFRFISGKPFTEADFISGLPRVVITNTLARKLFGSEDPIGKEVLMGYVPYAVTGVVEAPTRQPTVLMRMFGFPIPAIRIM